MLNTVHLIGRLTEVVDLSYTPSGNAVGKFLLAVNRNFEPLMTKVTRFLGIEHTCKRISLLTAVSLIYQAIPVVPTVFDDWI